MTLASAALFAETGLHDIPYFKELQRRIDNDDLPLLALANAIKSGDKFERDCATNVLLCNFHGLSMKYRQDIFDLTLWSFQNLEEDEKESLFLQAFFIKAFYSEDEFAIIYNEIEKSGSAKLKRNFLEILAGYEAAEQRRVQKKSA